MQIPKPPKRGPKPKRPLRRTKIQQRKTPALKRPSLDLTSPTYEFPRPSPKNRTSAIARREKRKKDRSFQEAAGGEGICENCQTFQLLTGHHLIPRRFSEHRHEQSNAAKVCQPCHNDIHSLAAKKLLSKYPVSKMRQLWTETLRRKA